MFIQMRYDIKQHSSNEFYLDPKWLAQNGRRLYCSHHKKKLINAKMSSYIEYY